MRRKKEEPKKQPTKAELAERFTAQEVLNAPFAADSDMEVNDFMDYIDNMDARTRGWGVLSRPLFRIAYDGDLDLPDGTQGYLITVAHQAASVNVAVLSAMVTNAVRAHLIELFDHVYSMDCTEHLMGASHMDLAQDFRDHVNPGARCIKEMITEIDFDAILYQRDNVSADIYQTMYPIVESASINATVATASALYSVICKAFCCTGIDPDNYKKFILNYNPALDSFKEEMVNMIYDLIFRILNTRASKMYEYDDEPCE